MPEPQLALYLICAAVPIVGKVSVPGHVNLYGCSNVVEDAAETFVFWMRGKKRNDKKLMNKCAVIESFVNGAYGHGTQELRDTYNPELLISMASDE